MPMAKPPEQPYVLWFTQPMGITRWLGVRGMSDGAR